jgi:molecular chaperone DnaJ
LNSNRLLQVPAGTQPGAAFRIPGEGLPGLRGTSRGDLVVTVALSTPTRLNDRQKRLLEEFLLLQVKPEGKRPGKRAAERRGEL